jgi:HK97 family phage prohead protease
VDPKVLALVGRHKGLLAQMRAIVHGAEVAGRELTGDELLQYEQHRSEDKRTIAELTQLDRLAARVAASTCADLPVLPNRAPLTLKRPDSAAATAREAAHARMGSFTQSFARRLESTLRYDTDQRTISGGKLKPIVGYAALFNVISHPIDQTGRRFLVRPGAFDLAGSAVTLCRGHDKQRPYASTRDGTLRLWEDERGLRMEAQVESTPSGADLVAAVARGTLTGLSAQYMRGRKSTYRAFDGVSVEMISRARIGEVSVVEQPLCPGAACWVDSRFAAAIGRTGGRTW